MAVTIVSNITSNSFLPVANPINITVNSNNTGKCNFRYVCDVRIDNVNVFRFKLFPDPVTSFGFFQLADVIGDYLKQNLTTLNTAGVYSASTSTEKTAVKVQLRFGEEYDNSTDCSQSVTVFPNLSQSNTFYAYYAGFDYDEWPEYNQSDYVVDFTTKPTKFLTKVPRGSVEASFADSYFLDFLSQITLTSNNTRIRIIVFKGAGQPVIVNILPPQFLTSVKRFRIACGPAQINRWHNSNLIDPFTTHYTVGVFNIATNQYVTEVFKIRVGKITERRKRIGFVNSLGSLDYITFFNRDRSQFTIDRKNYKQYLTSKKGNKWSYDVGDRQGTTYAVTAKEDHVVSTFVSRKTSEYLYEMWLSTDVWIDDRPRTMPFKVFKSDLQEPSLMLFLLPEDHGLKPGDNFFSYSSDNADFNSLFTVDSVNGRIVNVGATFNIFNLSDSACGFIVRDENIRKIPILPEDNTIEVKQKLDRPIEYTLTYSKSVDKITLRS